VKARVEVDEHGREWTITTLPPDKRLTPSATKKRQLFAALSSGQKREHIESRIRAAKRRRRRKRTKP
jgi:hypothetical protein